MKNIVLLTPQIVNSCQKSATSGSDLSSGAAASIAHLSNGYSRLFWSVLFLVSVWSASSVRGADQDANTPEKPFGVVTLSVANGRMDTSDRAELSTQALLGTPVKILKRKSWYFVETPEGYTSWMSPGSVKTMSKDELNVWNAAKKVIFTDHYGFAYKAAQKDGGSVSDIVFGNILKLEGEDGAFYAVSFPDDRKAFLLKEQCQPLEDWINSREVTEKSVVDKAFTLLGLPYFWGAASAKAVDCSGFVKTAYFMNGVILRRDSYQQVETGQAVDVSKGYDQLKPGDLLFFRRENETGNQYKIRHVAMYIGNMQFIHAGNPVKVNSFDPKADNYDSYETKTLIRATRIIGNVDTPGITTLKTNPLYQQQL